MITGHNCVGYTNAELEESFRILQGKTLQDLFTKDQLLQLEKDYFVSFNGGFLSLGLKTVHMSTGGTKRCLR